MFAQEFAESSLSRQSKNQSLIETSDIDNSAYVYCVNVTCMTIFCKSLKSNFPASFKIGMVRQTFVYSLLDNRFQKSLNASTIHIGVPKAIEGIDQKFLFYIIHVHRMKNFCSKKLLYMEPNDINQFRAKIVALIAHNTFVRAKHAIIVGGKKTKIDDNSSKFLRAC
jgi:hypothetical protein